MSDASAQAKTSISKRDFDQIAEELYKRNLDLHKERVRTAELLYRVSEAIYATDEKCTITLFNHTLEKLLKVGASEVLGKNVSEVIKLTDEKEDPFRKADEILKEHEDIDLSAIIVDFHAEATSEKYAMAFYLDGRVDAVVGTHTHVPTSDNRVLPEGTAFVCDVGMVGVVDSVLGVKTEIIQKLFLTAQNQKFDWETNGKKAFRSVIINTSKKSIDRHDKYL